MAVLVTANVDGQTDEGWDQIFKLLGPVIRQAKGFIAVGGGHAHDGWRVELYLNISRINHYFYTSICFLIRLCPPLSPKKN